MTRLQEAVLEVLVLGPGLNLAPDAQAKFIELGAAWMEETDGDDLQSTQGTLS